MNLNVHYVQTLPILWQWGIVLVQPTLLSMLTTADHLHSMHGCTHLLMFSGNMACSHTLCTPVYHADIGKSVVLCLERKKSISMSVGKYVYIFPLGHSNLKERKLLLDRSRWISNLVSHCLSGFEQLVLVRLPWWGDRLCLLIHGRGESFHAHQHTSLCTGS